jgi:hypothetical protein
VSRGGGGTRRRRNAAAERRGGGETRRRGDAAAGRRGGGETRHDSAAWRDDRWRFRGIVTVEVGRLQMVFLTRARNTRIRRHVKVKGNANPYEPAWELYFEERLSAQIASTLTGRGCGLTLPGWTGSTT